MVTSELKIFFSKLLLKSTCRLKFKDNREIPESYYNHIVGLFLHHPNKVLLEYVKQEGLIIIHKNLNQ